MTPRRLRVLFVLDHAVSQGGAERFVTGLATHLPQDRFEPWLCSTRHADPVVARTLYGAGVQHVSLERRSKLHSHRIAELVCVARQQRFDVLHAHMFGSNVWGVLIGRACHVPVVIAHEHNWSYAGNRARVWLDRYLIGSLATRFIAVSEANRKRMIELEGIAPTKILVMPTAYVQHPVQHDSDIRVELGLEPETPLIGVAAVLRKEKSLDILLDAHARLLDRVKDVRLVIAGDGPCRAELLEHSVRLGTRHHVHFLGRRHDVDAILQAVDVGALSSDWEGMPLFVFECMAANTPLVATAVGGIPEVVIDGTTGILVPPRDPAALAAALERPLTDRALATQLATAAHIRLQEFTIESVAVRFGELYEQLLAEVRRS